MARSKNGLRDFGPGGDKRPEFGPSYVLLPGQGAVTNYTLYMIYVFNPPPVGPTCGKKE